ncbi:hypothetical protein KY359_02030 [Candidatus Woesearchaeota archaeon]|nr:hypothetical protein [Candidatus Woesearchaeota archaeon]
MVNNNKNKKANKSTKPVVAFYDLTGCQGCVLTFLFNEDELLDLAGQVDIKAFRFAKGAKDESRFDLVFVEGLVANNSDLEVLKAIREKTNTLVALGACACTGCIPAYRNFIDTSKYASLVYEKVQEIRDQPATPISEHVHVDYFIPGCPPDKKQIASFIKDALLGKTPKDYDKPVCFECRLNENRCLLDNGRMCLGPITRGGCDSICTNGKLECWGCRGPTPDANIPLMIKLLEKKGFTKEHIKQRLRTFAGMQMEKPPLKTVKPKKEKKKPKKEKKIKKEKKPAKKAKKKPQKKAKKIPAKKAKAKKPSKSIKKKPSATTKRKAVSATKTNRNKPSAKAKKKRPVAKAKKTPAKTKKPSAGAKKKSFMGMLAGKLKKK